MEEHVKIKICGVTREEEIRMLNEAGVDYAGFVFYEKSKRNITAGKALKLKEGLAPSIKSVAVTVDPDGRTAEMIASLGFDVIQVHGEPDTEVIRRSKIPVWYAVNASCTEEAEEKIRRILSLPDGAADKIEAFVFDAPAFGSGKTSDWEGGRRPDTDRMFVLAGGLDSSNVNEGIRVFRPDVVDVSSSVEGSSGKDPDKVFRFVNTVRKGDGQ